MHAVSRGFVELGLVIPADFDQQAAAGEQVALEGYVPYWISDQDAWDVASDIETLIAHFLTVSWGPAIPPGEACVGIEATKGNNSYYLISDGGIHPYRVRIRTPSFAHIQTVPLLSRGFMVPDLVAILGSLDFVLADVDR